MRGGDSARRSFFKGISRFALSDGRSILLLSLIAYFSSILITGLHSDYRTFWEKYLRVKTSSPAFLDTHHLTSAIECTAKGYDVLKSNPCEPNRLPFDYPRVWLYLTALGINQSDSASIAITAALLFFISVFLIIGRCTILEGVLYSLVLCSPSVMLGIETGNTDLYMFSLLCGAVLLSRSNRNFGALPYFLILIGGILKLYPITALIACFKERKKNAIMIFGLIFVAFSFYVLQNSADILQIQRNCTKSTFLSYGFRVFSRILKNDALNSGMPVRDEIWWLCSVAAIISLFVFFAWKGWSRNPNGLRIDYLDSYRVGAGTYMISYLVWNNWDYRLMFLILALPQMVLWTKEKQLLSRSSAFCILAVVSTLWIGSIAPPGWNFPKNNRMVVDEVLNIVLFLYFSHTIFMTFPQWLKEEKLVELSEFLPSDRKTRRNKSSY